MKIIKESTGRKIWDTFWWVAYILPFGLDRRFVDFVLSGYWYKSYKTGERINIFKDNEC